MNNKTVSTPKPQTFTGENPFPAKTLTDEEIDEVTQQVEKKLGEKGCFLYCCDANRDFARAILRKAQEK